MSSDKKHAHVEWAFFLEDLPSIDDLVVERDVRAERGDEGSLLVGSRRGNDFETIGLRKLDDGPRAYEL